MKASLTDTVLKQYQQKMLLLDVEARQNLSHQDYLEFQVRRDCFEQRFSEWIEELR